MMRTLVTYVLILFAGSLLAQESRIIVSEDTLVQQSSNYDHLFSLMSQDRTKIKTLIKLNAVDWGQLHPSMSVETFIAGDFSLEPGLRLLNFGVSNQAGIKFLLEPSIIGKYYINFKRRERIGKNTNGFSGNYFYAGLALPFGDNKEWHTQHLKSRYFLYGDEPDPGLTSYYMGALQLGYGFQRRLANIGYIDVRGGYVRSVFGNSSINETGNLYIKIDIGFGLTKKAVKDLIE